MMRIFIAVDLPSEIKEKILSYCESISPLCSNIKWVERENFHLTLKFMGEINEKEFELVKTCVSCVAREFKPFNITLSGTGFFPDEKNLKIVWIGTDGGCENLLDLYQELENCLETDGFDRESKPFSPHLTIGRVKKNKKASISKSMPDIENEEIEVSRVSVFKSTLTPNGPIYEKLYECAFGSN